MDENDEPAENVKQTDANLPDPSWLSMLAALVLVGLTVLGAILFSATNADHSPFDPNTAAAADLALFAGFFFAATIIERALELVAPFVPFWSYREKANEDEAAQAKAVAQKKANRGVILLGLSALLGVLACAGVGLYLGAAIGMDLPRWADILASGLAVGGGTKGLHELVKALQKAKGSGTTAG